jgi:succinate dehydrogenase / fumarate reductase cytochrome b subunit
MASATGTLRHPKGPAKTPTGLPPARFARAFLDSSVGAKVLVALTGLGLVTFVIVHLIGNLKLFQGPDAINRYAYFLKHDLGVIIWILRAGLLAIFVLHVWLAARLKLRSVAARPVPYQHPGSVQSGVASRTMIWTGIVILLFVVFHLAHFTFGWVTTVETPSGPTKYLDLKDPHDPKLHNVYEMTVAGFRNPAISVFYLVCQVVLFVHLRHGIPSTFQTLGLKNARFRGAIDVLGLVVALTILIGNCGIVLAVLFGYVPSYLQ